MNAPDGDQAGDATGSTGNDNEDLKAKMREALERKQANDPGVDHVNHDRGHAEVHGPASTKRVHRRKSG